MMIGKRPIEAMRCLKRRLSDIVYRTMLDDVVTTSGTGQGGHRGASLISSAAGSQPHTDTSDQSLPGPVTHHDRMGRLAFSGLSSICLSGCELAIEVLVVDLLRRPVAERRV